MANDPRFLPAVKELDAWVGSLRLERPTSSQLHSLLSDWKNGKLIEPPDFPGKDFHSHNARLLDFSFEVLVIEHDWGTVLADESDAGDIPKSYDFRTPYERCCFEFVLSRKRVCLTTNFDGSNYRMAAFVRLQDGWLQPPLLDSRYLPLSQLLDKQFRAVNIILEASVAETEIVRVPEKLNRAREKSGKLPIFDYHTVRLAHRSRPLPLPASESDEPRRGPRLHFRRGHWRHFENHRSWINWTLVGDPELGFIEKHYRL